METLGLSTKEDPSTNTPEEDGLRRLERPRTSELVQKEPSGLSELKEKAVAILSTRTTEENGRRSQDLLSVSVLDQMEMLGLLTNQEESTITMVKSGPDNLVEPRTLESVLTVPSGSLEPTKKLEAMVSTEELL